MTTEATEATHITAHAADTTAAPGPDVAKMVARLRQTFATGRTRDLQWRKEQLRAMNRLMVENETKIADALEKDLGRSPFEAWLADVASTSGEAAYAAKSVGKWAKRRHHRLEMSQLPGRGWVEYEPYGTVLIIGAWNFPFALTLGPAVGAIAAGNTVLLKPSEVAPASSALMAELVPQYLDNDAIAVIEGDGAVSQELIAQGFDHLLFTGGTEIGRKVYEGAASHLTPVTLELGGKSPVIVSADADIKVAAKRIAWTKLINSGQICIAPDYVLAEAPIRDQMLPSYFFTFKIAFWQSVWGLVGKIVSIGIQLSAPSIIAILMTEMFLGIANRLAPQVQIAFLGMSLKSLLGLAVLCAAWFFILQQMGIQSLSYLKDLETILKSLQ